jgi:hypothetical protein
MSMRNSMWLVFALLAAVIFGQTVAAQPPDRPPGPPGPGGRGPGGPLERAVDDLRLPQGKRDVAFAAIRVHQDNVGRLTDLASSGLLLKMKEVLSPEEFKALQEAADRSRRGPGRRATGDDVVEHIMSFDKNGDGKVTKDELPERMQYLIEKGDTNKDGALDKEEIKKLAAELAKEGTSLAGGPDGRGRGDNRASPGSGLTLGIIERAAGELKLPEKKKEATAAAVKAQQEQARMLTTMARAELLLQVSEILSEDDLKSFKAVLDRQPGVGERPGGGRNGPPDRRGPPPRP